MQNKQINLAKMIEEVVGKVMDEQLKDERFRENRLHDFEKSQERVLRYGKQLQQSSRVTHEDMLINYNYVFGGRQ